MVRSTSAVEGPALGATQAPPCRSAHQDRAISQTQVVQTSLRMAAMDPLLPHVSGTTFTPDDLVALQAIVEPNRARIVELLGHGEHCVCDVGEALAMSPALVSHHLRVLRTSGLLRERRDGRWVLYALDLDRLARLRSTILEFLTPSDAAASACICSDCGPARESRPAPGDPLGRPLVMSASAR